MDFIDRFSGTIRVLLAMSIVAIHAAFYVSFPSNLIMSSMIESIFDVVVAIMITVSLKFSSKPPDKNHPYGHWKFENLGTISVGLLFLIPSYYLIKDNLIMLINGIKNPVLPAYDLWMVFFILFPTFLMILLERRKFKRENLGMSQMNYVHYLGDFIKILSVGATIIIMKIMYLWWLPSVVSIGIMIAILYSIIPQILENINALTDHEAPKEVYDVIYAVTTGYEVQNLRTRVSGPIVFIDFDIILKGKLSLADADNITLTLESNIRNNLQNAVVSIRSR